MSENDDGADDASDEVSAESLEERLTAAAEDIDAAETEADLDEIEGDLDGIEADLETADLPEPDDEDEAGPREELEGQLEDARGQLEDARGPYAEDVADEIDDASSDITAEEWTEAGVSQLVDAVESFLAALAEHVDVDERVDAPDVSFEDEPKVQGARLASLRDALDAAGEAVTNAGLDADEDAETIAALLEATDALSDDVDAAETWSDLSVRDQLDAHGYYDVLDHRKDYPPEWGALKGWEQENEPEMVLLALEKFDSDFMEQHCFEALTRMAPEAALDTMVEHAQKRNKDAITVLGKIGSDEPVEGLLNYIDGGDLQLRKVTMKALGEIGSEEATQGIANQLADEESEVRSAAARALGLIGDTRAIEPLADVLADDDEDAVRGAAAWALNQIGTERALDELREYQDDRVYVVQAEAEKAA